MADSMPDTWQTLQCQKCDGEQFVRVFAIQRNRIGGGTVERPKGWRCLACDTMADVAAMINAANVKQKREELERLQTELASATPTSTSRRLPNG